MSDSHNFSYNSELRAPFEIYVHIILSSKAPNSQCEGSSRTAIILSLMILQCPHCIGENVLCIILAVFSVKKYLLNLSITLSNFFSSHSASYVNIFDIFIHSGPIAYCSIPSFTTSSVFVSLASIRYKLNCSFQSHQYCAILCPCGGEKLFW